MVKSFQWQYFMVKHWTYWFIRSDNVSYTSLRFVRFWFSIGKLARKPYDWAQNWFTCMILSLILARNYWKTLNRNYVYHKSRIYIRTFSIKGWNRGIVYSCVLSLNCSNSHFHIYFHLNWLTLELTTVIDSSISVYRTFYRLSVWTCFVPTELTSHNFPFEIIIFFWSYPKVI